MDLILVFPNMRFSIPTFGIPIPWNKFGIDLYVMQWDCWKSLGKKKREKKRERKEEKIDLKGNMGKKVENYAILCWKDHFDSVCKVWGKNW